MIWQLFHIEKDLDEVVLERLNKRKDLEKQKDEYKKVEKETKDKKKDQAGVQKRFQDMERKIRAKLAEVEKSKPESERLVGVIDGGGDVVLRYHRNKI